MSQTTDHSTLKVCALHVLHNTGIFVRPQRYRVHNTGTLISGTEPSAHHLYCSCTSFLHRTQHAIKPIRWRGGVDILPRGGRVAHGSKQLAHLLVRVRPPRLERKQVQRHRQICNCLLELSQPRLIKDRSISVSSVKFALLINISSPSNRYGVFGCGCAVQRVTLCALYSRRSERSQGQTAPASVVLYNRAVAYRFLLVS